MLVLKICFRVFIVYIFSHLVFLTTGGSRKGPLKQDLSILPSILLFRRFPGILSLPLSYILVWCKKPIWSCVWQSRIFRIKIWKVDQKWAKNRVFWIYWNFYRICSVMKIYVIFSCVPAQIPHLEKVLFLR